MNKTLSDTFNWIKFPLCVMVIFIHAYRVNVQFGPLDLQSNAPIFSHFQWCISKEFGNIIVETFLFISGFLFFREQSLSKGLYVSKLQKRFSSLFIPYVLWNALGLLITFSYQTIGMNLGFDIDSKLIADYGWKDYLLSFWNGRFGADSKINDPICFQLWYVRDILIMSVLSPLVYFCIKRLEWIYMSIILVGYLFYYGHCPAIPHLSTILFFSMGAVCAIKGCNWIDGFKNDASRIILLYPALLIICCFSYGKDYYLLLSMIIRPLGVLFILNAVYYFIERGKLRISPFLTTMTFFIYCMHEPMQAILKKLSFMLLEPLLPNVELICFISYFTVPVIVLAVSLGTGYLMQKYTPKTFAILNGR